MTGSLKIRCSVTSELPGQISWEQSRIVDEVNPSAMLAPHCRGPYHPRGLHLALEVRCFPYPAWGGIHLHANVDTKCLEEAFPNRNGQAPISRHSASTLSHDPRIQRFKIGLFRMYATSSSKCWPWLQSSVDPLLWSHC